MTASSDGISTAVLCPDGYYLNASGACIACIANCKICNGALASNCNVPVSGYFFNASRALVNTPTIVQC